ncbi:MAG TPA: diguanylate cyclase [Baekduia sp.]|uniref:diguanylate cyclase domain-containing protein n=1 Tax=Baekduia sp. TaxID=2600305 RepID=UPI002D77AA13|nr:diguanylate cyclase [Baekduia sp.]HET6506043.1 diguanylate cyclase [Baekduia sp.]
MRPADPVTVLVVDDLPASRGLAAIWLSDGLRDRVRVVEASTLAEMRAAWRAERPDVVLLDHRLPDGEGLGAARELLADDPDAAIVLLTGMSDPALDQEAERIGITDFLVKHEIDGPMLARTVRYALRRREDRRRLRRSEERYRNLVWALPDTGVLVVDDQLRFVMAAGRALEDAGWDPAAMVGREVADVLGERGRAPLADHYEAALAGEAHESVWTSPNGHTYRIAFRPLAGHEAMAVTFDITEQLAAAAELQRAQALAHTGSWQWDAVREELTWSPELCRIYGIDPSARLPTFGDWLRTMVAEPDREHVVRVTRAALRDGESHDFDLRILRADGQERVLATRVRPVAGPDGAIVRVEGISQDVTAERVAQRARRNAERQFEVAFDRAPIGMFLATPGGQFLRVNDALCALVGHAPGELIGGDPLALVHPDDVAEVAERLAAIGDDDLTAEHRMLHRDGHEVWVAVNATLVRDDEGRPVHVLGQMRDVTEGREHEAQLRHLADHDPLTGLLNRRGFEAALTTHVARGRRYGAAGALLVLDLDGFKHVNDTHGHHAGDALLTAVADGLRERVRETDVLARLGGDEFAVLLPVETVEQAGVVAEALVAVVRERGAEHGVTASAGVALVDPTVTDGDALLVRADRAMYAAKGAGRDRVAHEPRTSRA